jgi:hydrogenase maturation protein HypF
MTNCIALLEKNGFQVYTNEQVPANDGGIALGQVYIAGRTTI